MDNDAGGPPNSSGSCFITTATLTALGKDDNCIELNMFRKFRDTYLKENSADKIQKYYRIAPAICDVINQEQNAKEIYKNIWERHLSACYHMIKIGEFDEAYLLYKKMVSDLFDDKFI